jgi:RNA polymerase sigma-70 factor (ECF subfamily)
MSGVPEGAAKPLPEVETRPQPGRHGEEIQRQLLHELEQLIPRLRRYARSLTRDETRADDLVQDTLIRAIDKLHLFEPGTNLVAWLFTIMRNIHINALRSAKWEREQDPSDLELPVPGLQLSNLALRDLARAMSALPDDQRETVMLVAVEGLAYQDAAEIMSVPIGTVRSRLSRARTRLRQLMYGEAEGEVQGEGELEGERGDEV